MRAIEGMQESAHQDDKRGLVESTTCILEPRDRSIHALADVVGINDES
jgi:hypothetical protein